MVDLTDIVSQNEVRQMASMVRGKKYQFRRLFRRHDATNANSSSFTFPTVDVDDISGDEVAEIPAGTEYPRANFDYGDIQAAYSKYGVELPITEESVNDSVVDVLMDGNRQLTEAEEERMDRIAFSVLDSNLSADGPIDSSGDASGNLEYADFTKARTTLFANDASLADLAAVVNPDGMNDLLNMDQFTQASEMGSDVITSGLLPGGDLGQGLLGMVGDIPVYASNIDGTLGAGEAIVADTSQYGWESERDPFGVDSYEEESKDQFIHQLSGRYDWVAENQELAIKIDS